MNSLPKLFLAIFLVFTFAWVGAIALPYAQIGHLGPQVNEEDGTILPPGNPGLADYGKQVYAAYGCIYCHSQQVRPEEQGSDIARGWGKRNTVARDYINDRPVLLGTSRTGPDLTNIGERQTSREWHHKHLFNPQSVVSWSIMPRHAFLYKTQKITGQSSPDALQITGAEAPAEGYEIVPTYEATALVEYLLSLKKDYALKEAPIE